jgi:hypothetical protein
MPYVSASTLLADAAPTAPAHSSPPSSHPELASALQHAARGGHRVLVQPLVDQSVAMCRVHDADPRARSARRTPARSGSSRWAAPPASPRGVASRPAARIAPSAGSYRDRRVEPSDRPALPREVHNGEAVATRQVLATGSTCVAQYSQVSSWKNHRPAFSATAARIAFFDSFAVAQLSGLRRRGERHAQVLIEQRIGRGDLARLVGEHLRLIHHDPLRVEVRATFSLVGWSIARSRRIGKLVRSHSTLIGAGARRRSRRRRRGGLRLRRLRFRRRVLVPEPAVLFVRVERRRRPVRGCGAAETRASQQPTTARVPRRRPDNVVIVRPPGRRPLTGAQPTWSTFS